MQHLVLVLQRLQQLADGLVEHGVLELGRQVGQRMEDEAPLVHQQVRNVQVVRPADHAVPVEEDVDVERPRRSNRPSSGVPGLRRRPSARSTSWSRSSSTLGSSEVSIATTQLKNQVSLAGRLARPPLPRLGLVERARHRGTARPAWPAAAPRRGAGTRAGRPDSSPPTGILATPDSPFRSAAACQLDAGVPNRPSMGGVSFRTRTRTSRQGNSPSSTCASRPASRSSRFTRSTVPISTIRAATRP